jgi:GT2 family glycosyltransferase
MSQTNGIATICVVNYKTADLTRLCLRSIRKYTRLPYEMVVVDNDSQDESLAYLKSLPWIRLIERKDPANDSSGGYAHAAALDLALEHCRTEFFVSLHSDTVVHREGWLEMLLEPFAGEPRMACVGGGKVELEEAWRARLKKATDYKTFFRKLFRVPDAIGRYRYYNRTVCCAYRTEILRKENLSFLMEREKGLTVGQKLYFELEDRGYRTVRIPDCKMREYVYHLAHATQVLNAEQYHLRRRTLVKVRRMIDSVMCSKEVQEILTDEKLDQ